MKKWAYVEQGAIKDVQDDLPKNWKNISNFDSLASDTAYLRSIGWYQIEDATPQYDSSMQQISSYDYSLVGDSVVAIGKLSLKPTETLGNPTEVIGGYSIDMLSPAYQTMDHSSRKAIFMTLLRAERDRRISLCDWTQLSDIVLIRSKFWTDSWRAYRQELRDLPDRYADDPLTNINGVIWPITPPSADVLDNPQVTEPQVTDPIVEPVAEPDASNATAQTEEVVAEPTISPDVMLNTMTDIIK